MYDISQYDVLLLMRAHDCGNSAPACLTGVKIADREEDNSWPNTEDPKQEDHSPKPSIEVVKENCECNGDLLPTLDLSAEYDTTQSSTKSRSSSKSRKRLSTVSVATGPPAVLNHSTVLSVNSDTPRHVCSNVIRKLLDQLTEIHDTQQIASRKEWDIFLKQRGKAKTLKSHNPNSTISSSTGSAAAILGLGTSIEEDELEHSEGLIGFAQLGLPSNRDQRREFDRLVRRGIPLVYRAKIWLECSGGLEMQEPGLFQDLLAAKDGLESVENDIEKDVGRTMPLNVFFGGDGAGVDKLRRVLLAYSRYACQLLRSDQC
jgi:hypothetical protein